MIITLIYSHVAKASVFIATSKLHVIAKWVWDKTKGSDSCVLASWLPQLLHFLVMEHLI